MAPSDSSRVEELRAKWEKDPSSRIYLQLADEYLKQGGLTEAAEVLRRGLEARPGDLSGQVALGRCLVELGEAEEATGRLESVLEKDPAHIVANKLLIRSYLASGRAELAQERLEIHRLLDDRDPELDELAVALQRIIEGAEGRLEDTLVETPLHLGGVSGVTDSGIEDDMADLPSLEDLPALPDEEPEVAAEVSVPPTEGREVRAEVPVPPVDVSASQHGEASEEPRSGRMEVEVESAPAPGIEAAVPSPTEALTTDAPSAASSNDALPSPPLAAVGGNPRPEPFEMGGGWEPPNLRSISKPRRSLQTTVFDLPVFQWAGDGEDIFGLMGAPRPVQAKGAVGRGPVESADPVVVDEVPTDLAEAEEAGDDVSHLLESGVSDPWAVEDSGQSGAVSEAPEAAPGAEMLADVTPPASEEEAAKPGVALESSLGDLPLESHVTAGVAEDRPELAAETVDFDEGSDAVTASQPEEEILDLEEMTPEPESKPLEVVEERADVPEEAPEVVSVEPTLAPEEQAPSAGFAGPAQETVSAPTVAVDDRTVKLPGDLAERFEEEASEGEPTGEAAAPTGRVREPSGPQATATLGELYLQQGHLDEAESIFEQVLAGSPDNVRARWGLRKARIQRPAPLSSSRLLAEVTTEHGPSGLTDKKVRVLQAYMGQLRRNEGRDVH